MDERAPDPTPHKRWVPDKGWVPANELTAEDVSAAERWHEEVRRLSQRAAPRRGHDRGAPSR